MKIFCLTCKKHILDTTDSFVVGGPYNGTMFVSTPKMPVYAKYPRHAGIVKANLQCPWCNGVFCGPRGELLTEHGKIMKGQTSYDPEFNIVWKDGPAKGQLMHIKDAPEKAVIRQNYRVDTFEDEDLEREWNERQCIFEKQPETQDVDPRKQKAYEMKDSGATNAAIAKEVGVSAVTIGKWLKVR